MNRTDAESPCGLAGTGDEGVPYTISPVRSTFSRNSPIPKRSVMPNPPVLAPCECAQILIPGVIAGDRGTVRLLGPRQRDRVTSRFLLTPSVSLQPHSSLFHASLHALAYLSRRMNSRTTCHPSFFTTRCSLRLALVVEISPMSERSVPWEDTAVGRIARAQLVK